MTRYDTCNTHRYSTAALSTIAARQPGVSHRAKSPLTSRFEAAMHCDQGPRENIEDTADCAILTCPLRRESDTLVAAVFDGVGGANFGEVASALARDAFFAHLMCFLTGVALSPLHSHSSQAIMEAMKEALRYVAQVIGQHADNQPRLRGMATTAVCAVMHDDTLIVAWCGDSRCFVVRNGSTLQVTRDHTQFQRLVDMKLVEPGEAPDHFAAHVITNFLGGGREAAPDAITLPLEPDDTVLLCTDGLTDVVNDANIARLVDQHHIDRTDFSDLPRQLVNHALQAGTQDNTTVLCARRRPQLTNQATHRTTVTRGYPFVLANVLTRLNQEKTNECSGARI